MSGTSAAAAVDFAALDVETANADLGSICSIGIATVRGGAVTGVWTSLVRPRGRFDPANIRIHGITEAGVAAAPTFAELHDSIAARLPPVVVTHTRFDVGALQQACRQARLPLFERAWLDSSRLPAIAWPREFRAGPRGLGALASRFGVRFRHHDAGEDARAAAEITLCCLDAPGASLGRWTRDFALSTHRRHAAGGARRPRSQAPRRGAGR